MNNLNSEGRKKGGKEEGERKENMKDVNREGWREGGKTEKTKK